MSWFPKPVGPRAAIADLRAFMRHGSREQFIGAALAILVTMIIIIEFLVDSKINTAPPPRVVEVQLYSSDRTDAEGLASVLLLTHRSCVAFALDVVVLEHTRHWSAYQVSAPSWW